MKARKILMLARAVSLIASPFYLPLVALLALFVFSYLSLMPKVYQLSVLAVVYVFTIFLPTRIIRFYHRYHGWTLFELGAREKRMIPYIVSILCYFFCYYVMTFNHVPHIMGSIVVTALATQVTCAVINMWWKISVHMAAIGAMSGILVVFAPRFSFNPVWWLCVLFLLAGMVGSARMILRQHNLHQIYGGFIVGFLVGVVTVILV